MKQAHIKGILPGGGGEYCNKIVGRDNKLLILFGKLHKCPEMQKIRMLGTWALLGMPLA